MNSVVERGHKECFVVESRRLFRGLTGFLHGRGRCRKKALTVLVARM